MTIQINYPGDAIALQKALGLKGGVRMVADEVVAPVTILQDLAKGPFADPQAVGQTLFANAGGVGTNAGVLMQAPAGKTLQIEQIEVRNSLGGGLIVHVHLIAGITLATVTIGTPTPFRNLTTSFAFFPTGIGGIPTVGSRMSDVFAGSQLGAAIYQMQVDADSSRTLRFPSLFVNGDFAEATGAPGVVVWCNTTNTSFTVSALGREFSNRA